MKARKIIAAVAAIVAGAVLASSGVASRPVEASAAVSPVTVITLNVHGALDRNGEGNGGAYSAILRDVLALIETYDPDVIMFQEFCYRQRRGISKTLAPMGWKSVMAVTRTGAKGCNDADYGNKIGIATYFKGDDITYSNYWSLPWGDNADGSTGLQPRKLICAIVDGKPWRACNTHFSPGDPDNTNQAVRALEIVDNWPSRLILGGDFNRTADRMRTAFPGYSLAAGRIDHVLSTPDGQATVKAVVPVPSSDHPALVARVAFS